MQDIRLVREDSERIRLDLQKRGNFSGLALLDEIISKDLTQRALIKSTESLRMKRNEFTKEADNLRRAGKDFSAVSSEVKKINAALVDGDEKLAPLKAEINRLLMTLPNLMHESVPVGKDDSENVVVKTMGEIKKQSFEIKHHGQLAAELGIADFERGVKISGSGFYFLKGDLAIMDISLQRLAIDILVKKGFILIQPPFLMKRVPYEGVTDLHDFENVMYKIAGDDLYLIATSEHPIGGMYMNDVFSEGELPLKLAGVSACFRREIGKHGLDERGLFRVHQFNKIEQFVFCKPEDSWTVHEEIRANAEELIQLIGIPYNITNICTGDLGSVAAKKYDINGWSPREQKYIELISCSNCTAYQAARLNIKYRKKDGSKELVHTLNSTMVATTRLLRLILENYQTKEGTLLVPKALQPYMGGKKEIFPQTSKGTK